MLAKSGRFDWIEIANGGAESVNLTGYFLSDSITILCIGSCPK